MKRFVVREKLINDFNYNDISIKKVVLIMEELILNDNNIILIPSVLNQVLYTKYKGKPISSSKNIAISICEFLNYVYNEVNIGDDDMFIPLKTRGIFALNFYHLASFINYCSLYKPIHKKHSVDTNTVQKGCSYKTIKQKERRLFEFYDFLISAGLLDDDVTFNIVHDSKSNRRILEPNNKLHYQVSYPSINKKGDKAKLKNLDEHIYQLLIEFSQKYTPHITLGIVFQIMGGLRKGELVNLRVQDILFVKNKYKLTAIIQPRQEELFYDRDVKISTCGVKKSRNQVIFNIDGSLYEYFEEHVKLRTKLLKSINNPTTALFVDTDGQSMTGSTYEQHFQKLKKIFLDELKKRSYTNYQSISPLYSRWGTHICRGIFTNLCIYKGFAKSIRDLANLRGDDSELSSKAYWDAATLAIQINNKINILSQIDMDYTVD